MQNFIVLGIIPGTHYQTTLSFWIGVAIGFLAFIILLMLLLKRHAIRAHFAARRIAHLITEYQLA